MPQATNFRIFNPDTMAKPTAGYSQVALVTGGNLVYIAGQVALDASGNFVGKDDFRTQVEQAFKNLKAAVEAARGNFHDIIKLNFYCVDSVDPSQIPGSQGSPRQVRQHSKPSHKHVRGCSQAGSSGVAD